MHLVTQRPRIVALVNRPLSGHVFGFITALHCAGIHHRHLFVAMVEVSVFKELNAIWAQGSSHRTRGSVKGTLVLRLAVEAAIAGLEVRASDVARRHLVQTRVQGFAR